EVRQEKGPAERELSLRYPRDASLAEFLARCTRRYTLQSVFSRDLAAAQEAGLLTITGLEAPEKLTDAVIGPPNGGVSAALEQAGRFAGRQVALDGLEHLAAGGRAARDLAEAVAGGLRRTGLEGVVNLAAAEPPSWAGPLARGPLFAAAPHARG